MSIAPIGTNATTQASGVNGPNTIENPLNLPSVVTLHSTPLRQGCILDTLSTHENVRWDREQIAETPLCQLADTFVDRYDALHALPADNRDSGKDKVVKASIGSRWACYLGACAVLAGCGSEGLPGDAPTENATSESRTATPEPFGEHSASFDIALDKLDPLISERAEYYLASFRDTPAAPTWSEEAALEDYARALYLPGMEEPAYYEFSVTEGGYFIISTGPHDSPLTNLNYKGPRVTQRLLDQAREQGRALGRLYKLSALHYAGEDENEQLVATHGLPRELTKQDWVDVKRNVIERDGGTPDQLLQSWERETRALQLFPKRPVMGRLHSTYGTGLFEEIDLSQWVDAQAGCRIGCGPVAWGILTVYMDYLAGISHFYPYSTKPQMYHLMNAGALLPGGANMEHFTPGPIEQGADGPTKDAIRGIRNRTGGFCDGITGQTVTLPTSMGNYADWANDKGANVAVEESFGLGPHTVTFARNRIMDADPALLGFSTNLIGVLDHYVVAHKYIDFQGNDEFYVNYGWPGDDEDQWISASTVSYAAAVVLEP